MMMKSAEDGRRYDAARVLDGAMDRRVLVERPMSPQLCELDATAHPPLQHDQLMTERSVLCLKSALRLEGRDEQGQEETEQRDHRR
jgi:hypothetical protein